MTTATALQRLVQYPTREAWLAARRQLGVGSSEVAALFSKPDSPLRGLSSFASPVSLAWEKRGLIERDDKQEEYIEWGNYVEPAIASWFDNRIREEVEPLTYLYDPGRHTIVLPQDDTPWFASVDRLLLVDPSAVESAIAPVEIKNASAWLGDEWEAEPPLPYTIQVQQQLAVLGLDRGYVCASIGGAPPKWARVKRDDELIAILRQRVVEFWRAVQAGDDPPMDASDATARALISRWPKDNLSRVTLTEQHAELWDTRQQVHEEISRLEDHKKIFTHTLKEAIGPSSYGDLPDGRSLSLITDKAGRRNLREKKGRG